MRLLTKGELILFLLLLTVYSYFVQTTGPDQLPRLDLILAIGHDGTLTIDPYASNSIANTAYNGHYYSGKSPGGALFGVPVYLAINALQGLDRYPWDNYPMLQYMSYLMTVFTIALPSALLALLFLRFLNRVRPPQGPNDVGNLVVTLILALGTPFLPYATLFYAHNLAAALGFAGFYLAFRAKEQEATPRNLALSGLLLGIGVFVELPTAIVAGFVFLYLFGTLKDRRQVMWFLAGLIPGVALFGLYNWAAFGSPFSISYLQEGSPNIDMQAKGLLGVNLPNLHTAWILLFSDKGLFVYSPVLLLTPIGLWSMARNGRWRAEGWLCLAITGAFYLLNSGYYTPFGDLAIGPRFLVPIFPFLIAPLALLWPRWRIPMLALGALSLGLMMGVTILSPYFPALGNPWTEHWLVALRNHYITLTMPHVRFGLRHAISLGLLLGIMAAAVGGWLAGLRLRLARPRLYERLVSVAVLALLLAYVVLAFPIDVRHPAEVPIYFRPPLAGARP